MAARGAGQDYEGLKSNSYEILNAPAAAKISGVVNPYFPFRFLGLSGFDKKEQVEPWAYETEPAGL